MTTTRQTLTGLALAICATLPLTNPTKPLLAEEMTFLFQTTIDASSVGGPANAPLKLTYTFDSQVANGTGPFAVYEDIGSYAALHLTLQVGDDISTSAGPGVGITVFNAAHNPDPDAYNVRSQDDGSVLGQLFGLDVKFFGFSLVDFDATMFASTALPLSPAFASGTDVITSLITLVDPATGENFYFYFEGATPFLLTLAPTSLINDLSGDVESLGLSQGLQNNLLAKLDGAKKALSDGNLKNDHVAVNKLQEFINQVSAQCGKKIAAADADLLIDEAEYIIGILSFGS